MNTRVSTLVLVVLLIEGVVMAAPVVTLKQNNVHLNSLIPAADLFDVTTDLEPITSYLFLDANSDADTGFFRLNGLAIANGTSFVVDAADLDKLEYVGGSRPGSEQFRVIARNRIGEFSDSTLLARVSTVRANTTKPLVVRPSFEVLANESVAASTFTQGYDPDGYAIEKYEFSDLTSVNYLQAVSGRIFVGSFKHNFRTGEEVTLQGVSEARFNVSGDITVVNENAFWINGATGVVDGVGTTAGAAAFSVDGGYFNLAGTDIAQGSTFEVTADQLADLSYHASGPANQENIFVRAYDGVDYSDQTRGVATTHLNSNAPFVQFSRSTTPAQATHSFADFLDISDADGSSIKIYGFYNTSPHANTGDLIYKGTPLARQQWLYIDGGELSDLTFETPQVGMEQLIRVQVYDGKLWSSVGTHAISSTAPLVRPEISPAADLVVSEQLRTTPLNGLFSKGTAGPEHTAVQVYEGSMDPESGTIYNGTIALAPGVIHEFTAAEYESNVSFQTGDFVVRRRESVYQRNSNGTAWSKWQKVDIATEPEIEDVLTSGTSWNGIAPVNASGQLELSFSFMQQLPAYGGAEPGPEADLEHFETLTDEQRDNVRMAFEGIGRQLNIRFFEVADTSVNALGGAGGILRFGEFGDIDGPFSAFAYFPFPGEVGGDVWFNRLGIGGPADEALTPGTFGYKVLIHEIGHALGLKHPHDGIPRLPESTDFNDFSVMSYQQAATGEPTTFQLYDVDELHDLYGPNTNYATGDSLYSIGNYFQRPDFVETIWDAGGTDELSAVGSAFASVVDLRAGQFSSIGDFPNNVTIAYGAEIENGTGSDNADVLIGNQLDNVLVGGLGDDELSGNGGADLLTGGEGNDTFVWGVGDGDDVINEQALAGRDTIRLAAFPGVDSVEQDLDFRLSGRDLLIDLTIDGGGLEGTLTVTNQLFGGYRVEKLEIGSEQIDLVNLVSQLAPGVEEFSVTSGTSAFGNLVTPVV